MPKKSTETGRWVTVGGKKIFIQEDTKKKSNRSKVRQTVKSGKSGKSASKGTVTKLRDGSTGKAKKPSNSSRKKKKK